MNYEKINKVLMKILEKKYDIKIEQKVEEKKVQPKKPSYDIDDDLPPIPVFLRRNRK